MKIQNTGSDPFNRLNVDGVSNVDPAAKTSGSAGAVNGLAKDQAALSERGRALSKARAALAEVPAVRADKVQALREQIQTGAYRVPHQQLAGRLLARL